MIRPWDIALKEAMALCVASRISQNVPTTCEMITRCKQLQESNRDDFVDGYLLLEEQVRDLNHLLTGNEAAHGIMAISTYNACAYPANNPSEFRF